MVCIMSLSCVRERDISSSSTVCTVATKMLYLAEKEVKKISLLYTVQPYAKKIYIHREYF